MTRFALAALAAALGALAPAAAPVPKGAEANGAAPDLKLALDAAARAVKANKWPGADDEKLLLATARQVFDLAHKAADLKPRPLPADAAKLAKLDVTEHHEPKAGAAGVAGRTLDGRFLVCGAAKGGPVKNSVVFASGDVQFTTATNSVIVGKNVRLTSATNCAVIAGEYLRLSSARKGPDGEGSVLVAGQWLRGSTLTGAVCHVVRPTGLPIPDDAVLAGAPPGRSPAVRAGSAPGTAFLNDPADVSVTAKARADTKFLPPKAPIAK